MTVIPSVAVSICIVTSFRSFSEASPNTFIQKRFLESLGGLRRKFLINLIVVQWEESGVLENLQVSNIPFTLINLGRKIPFYRYSLSEVLENSIPLISDPITIYTTCDVVLTEDFVFKAIHQLESHDLCIPYPYTEVSLNNTRIDRTFSINKIQNEKELTGFDIFVFKTDKLRYLHLKRYFRRYRMLGWGMFDHFLVLLALQNDFAVTKTEMLKEVTKYLNDREENAESQDWMRACHQYNTFQFRRKVGADFQYLPLLRLKGLHLSLTAKSSKNHFLRQFVGSHLICSQVKFLFLAVIKGAKKVGTP